MIEVKVDENNVNLHAEGNTVKLIAETCMIMEHISRQLSLHSKDAARVYLLGVEKGIGFVSDRLFQEGKITK